LRGPAARPPMFIMVRTKYHGTDRRSSSRPGPSVGRVLERPKRVAGARKGVVLVKLHVLTLLFAVTVGASGCAVTSSASDSIAPTPHRTAWHWTGPDAIGSLRTLGVATVQRSASGTLQYFGGISGADWDPRTDTWLLLSDDKSEFAPARFYEARIDIGPDGLRAIDVQAVVTLRQPDGTPYPSAEQVRAQPGTVVPDPEAVRIDPRDGSVLYTSEGDRRLGLDPFVRRATRDGRFISEMRLPANLAMHRDETRGPRHNLSLEGLAFTPDAETLWLSMEAPLYEDGEAPSLREGAMVRFTKLNHAGRVLGQYAYPVDATPIAPSGGQRRSDNGVSEILAVGADRLLVVERSGHEIGEQQFAFSVRLYEADFSGASDVSLLASLKTGIYRPATKRLLLDLSNAGVGRIDNLEAAAWGPRLPNGHATLLLISDDNFAASQVNQFIALEVLPP